MTPQNLQLDYTSDHTKPDPHRPIHWAAAELDQEIEALRRGNWITDGLIDFSAKHWQCSRQEALERLLTDSPG